MNITFYSGLFSTRGFRLIYSLLFVASVLMAGSCSKELKAGDPISVTYDKVYLIGDASPAGWTIANAVPMTVTTDPTVFTWTGNLVAGEIKFPTAMNFSSDTFAAATASQVVSNSKGQLAPGGNPDVKWKLSAAEAGRYQITVNTKAVTVEFKKL